MRNALLTIGVIAVAAAILTGMVLYSVSFLRQCQMKILTGDLSPIQQVSWTYEE